jgi:uncharacterized phosphosugar-binding protein
MGDMINTYINTCIDQLQTIARLSSADIEAAAQAVATAVMDDQHFYLFGSGHSALIAREAFWRAGGLAPALPIPDPMSGDVERLSGFAATLLAHYDLQAGDVIIIVSNSGINHLPLEIALESKTRGLTVIGLTCLNHSQSVQSRHPSGKKLLDIADIIIDTHGVMGDAAVMLPGIDIKVGATSTVIGTAIIEAITSRAAEIMLERGFDPPVVVSVNTPAGDAQNFKMVERYRSQLVRHEVPTVDAPEYS